MDKRNRNGKSRLYHEMQRHIKDMEEQGLKTPNILFAGELPEGIRGTRPDRFIMDDPIPVCPDPFDRPVSETDPYLGVFTCGTGGGARDAFKVDDTLPDIPFKSAAEDLTARLEGETRKLLGMTGQFPGFEHASLLRDVPTTTGSSAFNDVTEDTMQTVMDNMAKFTEAALTSTFAASGGRALGHYKIVEDHSLMKAGEPVQIRRTWKERLFTRPWRPLQSYTWHTPMVPDRSVYMMDGCLVCHPSIASMLREAIKDDVL